MLGVEQYPVETGIRNDFSRDVAAQARPQTDLELARGQSPLENVSLKFRHVFFLRRHYPSMRAIQPSQTHQLHIEAGDDRMPAVA
jgi:hypothetical protein